jgi:hypothetical protein
MIHARQDPARVHGNIELMVIRCTKSDLIVHSEFQLCQLGRRCYIIINNK